MEKRLTVKFQKLLGSPVFPPGSFVEIQKSERKEGDASQRRGTLFSLITLAGPADFDAPVFGRAIFDTLEEEYFSESTLPPLPALEKAAFSAHRRLVGMTLSARISQSVDFNLGLAVLWGQVLYLCRLGSAVVYLLRDGKFTEVSLGEETLVSCASGFVCDGDTLIIGSREFKTLFPVSSLAGDLLKIEEKMQTAKEKGVLSALVLKIQLEEYPGEAESIHFAVFNETAGPAKSVGSVAQKFTAKMASFREFGKKLNIPLKGHPRLVRRSLPGRKFWGPAFLLAVLAVFSASVYFTIQKQSKNRMEALVKTTLSQAELDMVNASDLVGINDLSDAKASEILEKTIRELRSLEKLGVREPRLNDYVKRAQELLTKVSKETLVVKPRLAYDFSLIEKSIVPVGLAGIKDSIFTVSAKTGAVFELKIPSPADTRQVSGTKVDSATRVTAFGERVFVFAKNGVNIFNVKTKEFKANAALSLDLSKYFDYGSYNSNLYFLDSRGGQILRALYGEKGYSKPTNWLKETANLENSKNFAINGAVYVLFSDGRVLKFEGGRPSDFSLTGYGKSLSKNTYIYAVSGVDSIYLVDKESKKIVQFDGKGSYQKSYDFGGSEVASIDSVYVNSDNQNLYVLSGTKVYEAKP